MSQAEDSPLVRQLDQEVQAWSEWFGIAFSIEAGLGLARRLVETISTALEQAGQAGETKGFAAGYAARVAEEQMGYDPYEK
jgi:hypothetical protein